MAARTFALIGTRLQWDLVDHEGTRVLPDGTVTLDEATAAELSPGAPTEGAPADDTAHGGIAFDGACNTYRILPERGQVVTIRRRIPAPGGDRGVEAIDLLAPGPEGGGDFTGVPAALPPLLDPRALAIDAGNHLFVAEAGARRVLVYDLEDRKLARRLDTTPARPLDLAVLDDDVLALLHSGQVIRFTARGGVRPVRLPRSVPAASRLALSQDGRVALLEAAAAADRRVFVLDVAPDPRPGRPHLRLRFTVPTPYGCDVEFDGDGVLAVAGPSGGRVSRYGRDGREMNPLATRRSPGTALARTPEGRIGFWTPHGLRTGFDARIAYRSRGRIATGALDGGEFQRVWGRLFIEACVPVDGRVRVRCAASDDAVRTGPIPQTVPFHDLFPRDAGADLPWTEDELPSGFTILESPVITDPGRYLRVEIELAGSTRVTPVIRALRAEFPSHDHLRRLPAIYSRQPDAASFLRRYLAPFDGMIHEMEERSAERHLLLDPCSTPASLLEWLARFLGLTLDAHWDESTRRALTAEAAELFRRRGTVWGLRRFLELYVRAPVFILEHYRLRGLGGAPLGKTGPLFTTSVLGGGFRVGGNVGPTGEAPLEGERVEAVNRAAHRFTVLIAASLDSERMRGVRRILEVHRPAHTIFDVCTAATGIRVGQGAHVGLSTLVGRSSGFSRLRTGASVIGRDAILARPRPAAQLGGVRLGIDTEVG